MVINQNFHRDSKRNSEGCRKFFNILQQFTLVCLFFFTGYDDDGRVHIHTAVISRGIPKCFKFSYSQSETCHRVTLLLRVVSVWEFVKYNPDKQQAKQNADRQCNSHHMQCNLLT